MSMWQGAWHILIYELRKTRWSFLGSLFLALYMAIVMGVLYRFNATDVLAGEYWAIDFVFLTTLPCLGFVLSRSNMSWRNDTNRGKLAEWRTMPITVPQLIWGRMLQIAVMLFPLQIIFFLIQYFLVDGLREAISPGAYLLYGLFWFLYSLGIAATYAIWEYGFTGKTYLVVCVLYCIMFLLISALLSFNGISIVNYVLTGLEDGEWWYLLVGLLISMIGIAISYRSLKHRLETRSF
ncbi:hypothetical protein SAMN04487969_15212 [Paenibacillus algorifonticola]|uniref:ABC-2 family transporter protein n=1 Tax=Paenibacillus algorifonticola TaxID=684063 RepID=A0A1I2J666_9BACL|nr:hypothetical protein [Paenibacillus algorifonticola]SFF48727.1 hypothetical protein SAMN04487969_15212 [Paenibacillus algorifonticola]